VVDAAEALEAGLDTALGPLPAEAEDGAADAGQPDPATCLLPLAQVCM
jgi:hypothetical protein